MAGHTTGCACPPGFFGQAANRTRQQRARLVSYAGASSCPLTAPWRQHPPGCLGSTRPRAAAASLAAAPPAGPPAARPPREAARRLQPHPPAARPRPRRRRPVSGQPRRRGAAQRRPAAAAAPRQCQALPPPPPPPPRPSGATGPRRPSRHRRTASPALGCLQRGTRRDREGSGRASGRSGPRAACTTHPTHPAASPLHPRTRCRRPAGRPASWLAAGCQTQSGARAESEDRVAVHLMKFGQ